MTCRVGDAREGSRFCTGGSDSGTCLGWGKDKGVKVRRVWTGLVAPSTAFEGKTSNRREMVVGR